MHYLRPVRAQQSWEDATITVRIRANRKEADAILASRRLRGDVKRTLVQEGALQEEGCDCTHCRNDWDCCGRFIVSHTRIRRAKRGLLVVQSLARNV